MSKGYEYNYEYDTRYCYPKTSILINKMGVRTAEELKVAEREITSLRIANARVNKIVGNFDFEHLRKIHKYIFQDIYEWAGQIRWVNIAKGNMFCSCEFIQSNTDSLFQKLKKEYFFDAIPDKEMPKRLAYYFSEINVIHPFREGNGRTQRLFIEYLAEEHGYEVDFSNVSQMEMIQASAEAFACHYDKMNELFERITEPKQENLMEQNML